jgi:hypothetical protein
MPQTHSYHCEAKLNDTAPSQQIEIRFILKQTKSGEEILELSNRAVRVCYKLCGFCLKIISYYLTSSSSSACAEDHDEPWPPLKLLLYWSQSCDFSSPTSNAMCPIPNGFQD